MTIDFDIPIGDYHRSPHISASKLGDYAKHGPRWFAARHVTSSTYREGPGSDAQVFGQAFEDLVQRPSEFASLYAVRPEGMKFTTKEGKAWRDSQTLPIIDQADLVQMEAMGLALAENATACALIAAAKAQATVRCEHGGVPGLQSRPDWFSSTGCAESGYRPYTLDLKTTLTLHKLASGRAVAEYRYHVQAAIAGVALARNGLPDCAHYLLASEKAQPYRCQVIELGPDWTSAGWSWAERQLQALAAHYAANDWPRCEQELVALPAVPQWVVDVAEGEESE